MMQELFSVELPGEPGPEMKEKLHRYLHFRFPTRNAKAYKPDCAAIAWVDQCTQLELLRPSGGQNWRIACRSTMPERLTSSPAPTFVGRGQKNPGYALPRLKPGSELHSGRPAMEALQQRVIETVAS